MMTSDSYILVDVIAENGGIDGGRVWIRRYPLIPGAPCPVCNTSMFREKSLSTHVKAHFKGCSPLLAEKWACSMCERHYDTRQGVANHFSQAHSIADGEDKDSSQQVSQRSSQSASQRVTPASQGVSCQYCGSHFTTVRGLRNHERARHQVAVSDTLATQDDPSPSSPIASKNVPRLPWSVEEISRFRTAVEKHGLHSNKIIAAAIGNRTIKQVAQFKMRYIKSHEQWAYKHLNAPSLGSQKDQATQSSPSTSPSSRRSVSSRSQHSGSVGSPDSRNDAEEASSSPSPSGVSIPLAFRGQRNPLLEKADQLLAGLRARVHPTPDKRMGISASSQHTCTTPKVNTASTEVQSSSSLTGLRLGSLVWNDADAEARSSGGGEGMCTPPPIEGIESLGMIDV